MVSQNPVDAALEPFDGLVVVLRHLSVRHPQHDEPSTFEVAGAPLFFFPVVRAIVDLDDNLWVETGEIHNPDTDRDLAPESYAQLTTAQGLPEDSLGDCFSTAELTSALGGKLRVPGSGHASTVPASGHKKEGGAQ